MTRSVKIGILVGALVDGWHMMWAAVVLVGWAQLIIDFVFGHT